MIGFKVLQIDSQIPDDLVKEILQSQEMPIQTIDRCDR